ncbi:MAG: hypothetical protein LUD18_08225 [Lachnospiraceae bacterium]|nr:hypothetical protein [Lachnospiraceae bacterium]
MSYAGLTFTNDHILMEQEYSLLHEANVATLLTTGNGYMGVRASLEEFSSLGIQGFLVRGVMDEVVEVRLTMCDNMYMKKYYVEEERLKKFEKEERAINLLDFLLIRFEIGGEIFYPWEGTVHSWKRWLDLSDETLHREVVWENSKGQKSRFSFVRFASFADDHTYCMRASIEPLNYSGEVSIYSGLDLRTKSNGQMPQKSTGTGFEGQTLWQEEIVGPKYGFHAVTGVANHFSQGDARWENIDGTAPGADERAEGLVMQKITFAAAQNQCYTLDKLTATVTSRDFEEGKVLSNDALLKESKSPLDCVKKYLERLQKSSYEEEYKKHSSIYQDLAAKLEVSIKGDETADRAIRFSNYHTLLSIARNDYVHSFSAKGLTGETYNNFVWWDAEIFQAPVFQQTMPEYSKNNILFRYSHLPQARKLAEKEGCRGARFPFTTGVTGEETVWIDVRHPFMQIHCVSDVALSVLNYYTCTGDEDFLKKYGIEILLEVCRYWASRAVWNDEKKRYEIFQVTGTDEHHPYVDNNAYTNYSVHHVLSDTLRLFEQFEAELSELKTRIGFTPEDAAAIADVAQKLYLPLDKTTGMIPQFDGYFDLSRELEVQGGSKSGYTQMKQAGLYNKSQVIKQPDVLMLFAYQNLADRGICSASAESGCGVNVTSAACDCGGSVQGSEVPARGEWRIPMPAKAYSRNLDYYQGRCEAASSLSYCVHSICFADMDMPESTYGYLMETAEMDLKNMHGGTENGVHSGCATGAWMAVVRGVAGMKMTETHVEFDPHFIPWWEEVSFHCIWHGQGYQVTLSNEEILVSADVKNQEVLPVVIHHVGQILKPGETGRSTIF